MRNIIGFIIVVAFLFVHVSTSLAEKVSFKGSSLTADGKAIMLTGELSKPIGEGPFPAIVMLHGCFGPDAYKQLFTEWAKRLAQWGYVSMQIDSFGPRGEKETIERCVHSVSPSERAQDAFDSKYYLSSLPFVDKSRMAVIGWSHGGWSVLRIVNNKPELKNTKESISINKLNPIQTDKINSNIEGRSNPFKAAVAIYPYCLGTVENNETPLLILIGVKDDWTPVVLCRLRAMDVKPPTKITLIEYPNAYHCFDMTGIDRVFEGHRLLYDKDATNDLINQIQGFLAKYLK